MRIPRAFRMEGGTMEIFRRGDEIVLRKPVKTLAPVFHLLAGMPDDFFAEGRKQGKMQKRRRLF